MNNLPENNKKSANYIKIQDYKEFDYEIGSIFLDFILEKEVVIVNSELKVSRLNKKSNTIILDGVDIEIIKIYLDHQELEKESYLKNEKSLIISLINKDEFTLKIEGTIKPKKNFSLLGMYESNGIITTQCEAEGFRRITYHPDRPDILSKYKVRIEANKNDYPVLLSNGNIVKKSNLRNKRHAIIWEDPFPKPSYLFALVAGKLNCVKDYYITKSKKKVAINIYVEKGDEIFVSHAINSLKRAMSWDEDKYNLEYDLSVFNIVAIRHFNMGAMENKSLNIFNSKLILADSETSTDQELERIESVIAHEYFHNWTGNRITCRDWFQLSLKEGLTVFRDQEFTSDLHNPSIKRLEDGKFLRLTQFSEDSGPTSHPVMPEKYLEIDNFYTTTIYEKGAEIIRMIKTLVKDENFQKGFSNYISTYDGKAATIDQFLEKILENNKEIDIKRFKIWYKQNGTPKVKFKRIWDHNKKILQIEATQSNSNIKNSFNKIPLIIPINTAIFLSKEKKITKTFILSDHKHIFTIDNINTNFDVPIVSYFRNFSAPVEWETDNTFNEKLLILEYETDYFIIYDTIRGIYNDIISKRLSDKRDIFIENKLIETLSSIMRNNKTINLYILSELLSIPTFNEIESELNDVDPFKTYQIIDDLNYFFGTNLKTELSKKLKEIEKNINKQWPDGKDERKLIATIWKLLLHTKDNKITKKVSSYINSRSMTLAKGVLNVMTSIEAPERKYTLEIFFEKWKDNQLVLDNWFFFKASIAVNNQKEIIDNLFESKYFDLKSPNTLRSILNGYVTRNRSFHSKDGSGYKYFADKIIEFDKLNPIVVSRLLKVFSRFRYYKNPYKENMIEALKYIQQNKLSQNTREVVESILNL